MRSSARLLGRADPLDRVQVLELAVLVLGSLPEIVKAVVGGRVCTVRTDVSGGTGERLHVCVCVCVCV